ncbi:MAG: histidinol-phosphate transaminase [Alphaproteobacteria bacterium]|nr:histidinol-phosphate transaminase [Alphaproteobacteria bacterium]
MPPRPVASIASLPILPIGDSGADGVSRIVGLANNENAERPSPAVLAAIAEGGRHANRYPDVGQTALREAIARRYGGLNPDRIVCGVGSSDLIALLAQCYCGTGDETLIGRQGYLYFAIATRAAGGTPALAGSDVIGNRPGFDPDAILAAVTPRTRIVFLDNPSNPLGTIVDRNELHAFRAALREDILLVLDAAYADYVIDPDFDAGDSLVDQGDNTVVLRTFSKIYGLAGLRVGWAHASAGIAQTLRRIIRPGSIASPSLAAAVTAVGEAELIAARRQRNADIRDRFAAELSALPGVSVLPSHTNFVFTTFHETARHPAAAVCDMAKAEGVLLRPMGPYGQPNSLRITIGTAEDMEIATQVLRGILT